MLSVSLNPRVITLSGFHSKSKLLIEILEYQNQYFSGCHRSGLGGHRREAWLVGREQRGLGDRHQHAKQVFWMHQ